MQKNTKRLHEKYLSFNSERECVCKREWKTMKGRIHLDKRLLYKRDSTNASRLCRLKYLSDERLDVYSFQSVSQNVPTCQRVTVVNETTGILVGCQAFHVFTDT